MVDVQVNGETRRVDDATTVSGLMESLGVSPRLCAVEINRAIVPKSEHATRTLRPGDTIEIVTFVGGG